MKCRYFWFWCACDSAVNIFTSSAAHAQCKALIAELPAGSRALLMQALGHCLCRLSSTAYAGGAERLHETHVGQGRRLRLYDVGQGCCLRERPSCCISQRSSGALLCAFITPLSLCSSTAQFALPAVERIGNIFAHVSAVAARIVLSMSFAVFVDMVINDSHAA